MDGMAYDEVTILIWFSYLRAWHSQNSIYSLSSMSLRVEIRNHFHVYRLFSLLRSDDLHGLYPPDYRLPYQGKIVELKPVVDSVCWYVRLSARDRRFLNSNHHVVSVFPRFCGEKWEPFTLTVASLHSTCLLTPHPLPTLPTNLQPYTLLFCHQQHPVAFYWWHNRLVSTSNYQHRQQNPPNVPIIELGELVGLGRDISWREVTVGIRRYRDSTEFLWLAGMREGPVWLDGRPGYWHCCAVFLALH